MKKFLWYDPYASFLAGGAAAFRNAGGQPIDERYNCEPLAELVVEALALVDPIKSRKQWEAALDGYTAMVAEFRSTLVELEEKGRLTFQAPGGQEFTPDWADYTDATIVQTMHRIVTATPSSGPKLDQTGWGAVIGGPLFFACLQHIDDALMSLHMGGDAGELGITSTIGAMACLANLRAVLSGAQSPYQAMGKLGASHRHAGSRLLKMFAVNSFKGGTYPSAHKASIELTPRVLEKAKEIGVRLSEDRATKTIYTWLLDAKD